MIVVHFVTIPTLQKSLDFFQSARIDHQVRRDIAGGGEVNVSAHYLVDRDGTLYQLAAEDILCRHIIGFNHSAIGIENVAVDADDLTEAQLAANAALISRIVQRQPSIRYLLGHHEYRDRTLPHYQLYREVDPTYRFTNKVDPGPLFMTRLRALLENRYDIRLQR
jgi:N-acetyl-anhydromuramyl-L-alanine amidase AmpD